MNLSLVELTAMADDPASTAERLAEVADELRYRKTKGARQLLTRLEGGAPTTHPRKPVRQPKNKRQTGRVRDAAESGAESGPSAVPAETPEMTAHSRDIKEQLEVLRTTFTLESEILARWGITSALPCEFRRSVLREWSRVVTDESDDLGRSKARLARDIEALQEIAASRKGSTDNG